MSNMSYSPYGNTFCRVVTAASQAVPLPTASPAPTAIAPLMLELDYRFTNIGTQAVFIATAGPGAAAPTATIPADGANAAVLIVEAGTTRTFSFAYGTQFAAIAAATGSTLYVSLGDGVNL
jgi:hypothetical protein